MVSTILLTCQHLFYVKYVDNIRRYYDALVWLDENDAIANPSTEENIEEQPVISPELDENTAQPADTQQQTSSEQQKPDNN